jgi:hypothetical protein
MDREYVSIVLAVLAVCAVRCLVTPRAWAALGVLVSSAVWLPANNGVAEGPVLLSVGETHGLTVADLVGLTGIALGAYTLIRLGQTGEVPKRWADPRLVVALAVVLAGLGFFAAYQSG